MSSPDVDVAIVGGGFTGALLALQLQRRAPDLSLLVVDRGGPPGLGVAYRTEEICHLLNVPAACMSALPDQPDHFLDWARTNHSPTTGAWDFLPRAAFGRYIQALLKPLLFPAKGGVRWVNDEVLSVRVTQRSAKVVLAGASSALRAKVVVLATGNAHPSRLRIPGLGAGSPNYLASPWSSSVFEGIPPSAEIVLIGSGLTSIDVALAWASRGSTGRIHLLSRHGLLPRAHGQRVAGGTFRFLERNLRSLVRQARSEARKPGADWQAIVDGFRPLTQSIWRSWSLKDKGRFLRHVRPYWEVHRHRIAPEAAAAVSRLLAADKLRVHSGRITGWEDREACVRLRFRDRRSGEEVELVAHRVINCTGPEPDLRRIESPLIRTLLGHGIARPGPLGLGLDTDDHGAVVDASGVSSKRLYAIGPLLRGRLWETTAVPELRLHAALLAATLVDRLTPAWAKTEWPNQRAKREGRRQVRRVPRSR